MVINVPDLSLTAEVKALGPATVQAAKQFVFSLDGCSRSSYRFVPSLKEPPSIWWTLTESSCQSFLTRPDSGFTNSVGIALNPATDQLLVSDPNDYVFWDGFHPTTKVHLLAAEFIYQTLASEHGFREFGVASKRH